MGEAGSPSWRVPAASPLGLRPRTQTPRRGLFFGARRGAVQVLLAIVVAGNLCGLGLLVAALLTEQSIELSGAQLLTSGAVVWLTNVIVFGLSGISTPAGRSSGPAKAVAQGYHFSKPLDPDKLIDWLEKHLDLTAKAA